jgi:hypothetical protein
MGVDDKYLSLPYPGGSSSLIRTGGRFTNLPAGDARIGGSIHTQDTRIRMCVGKEARMPGLMSFTLLPHEALPFGSAGEGKGGGFPARTLFYTERQYTYHASKRRK